MKSSLIFALVLSVLVLGACRDHHDCPTATPDTVVVRDRQIRLMLPAVGLTAERDWNMMPAYAHLQKFDKSNYPGVDSAVLSICFTAFQGTTGEAELYDVTAGRSIGGTRLLTTPVPDSLGMIQECRLTGNVWDSIQAGERDLAIRLRGTQKGSQSPVGVFNTVLYLYRK